MTDQEQKILELANKAKKISDTVKTCSLKSKRNRKYIKQCRKACKHTNYLIGTLNDRANNS